MSTPRPPSHHRPSRSGSERRHPSARPASRLTGGQAIVWVAVMLPYFLAIVGLAVDGGIVFQARRELQNVADGAARAGAEQLDLQMYRDTNGERVELDRPRAEQAAYTYLDAYAPDLTREASTSPRRIVITVREQVPTAFLRLVGISSVPVVATAPAEVLHGVEQGIS